MNKLSSFLFGNWLKPVLFTFVAQLVLLAGFYGGISSLEITGFVLVVAGFAWMLASLIYLLIRKEWWKSFYMFTIMLTFIVTFGLMQ